ncbi:MAG: ABC transporter ATP-binding protein [Actinomycetaceae bacterium]|nr:ABC transporter ATP-binding protein [Actinomycetaceae bacterium]
MLFRLVWRYLRHHIPAVVAIILLQLIAVAASLFLPDLNARIINEGVVVGDTNVIWRLGVIMLGFSAVQAVTAGAGVLISAVTSMGMGRWLRREQFKHAQSFSTAQLSHIGPPSLITRNTNDVQQIQMVTMMTFTIMVMAPLMGVGAVIMALRQSVQMSGLLLVAVPLVALVIGVIMARMHPLFKTQQERIDRMNTTLREQLSGVRVIRAFVRQDTERKKYQDANADLRDVAIAIGKLFAVMFPAAQFIIWMTQVAVIWYGGHLIEQGSAEVGSLIAFINYLMQIFMSVMMAGFMFVMVPRGSVSAERVLEVLETESDLEPAAQHREITGPVEFSLNDVTVSYPGAREPVLQNLSVKFPRGTITGVVGPTASGKSTLVNILPRLFDVSEGEVRVDGHPIKDFEIDEVRRRISLVPQKAYLFSGTIASTVAGHFAQADVDRERVEWALKGAQAWEFVSKLDDGIDSEVEAGGQNFSGGQKQRLAIARALYRDADLYIFDDSLSALDAQTEQRLRDGLSNYVGDAAVIVVSQKTSSIVDADQILVLGEGDVQGLGTHEELMQNCWLYREIAESQSGEVRQ